jgi:hypothetical protein
MGAFALIREVRVLARLEGWPQAPPMSSFEARQSRLAPQDDGTMLIRALPDSLTPDNPSAWEKH